MSRDRSHRVMNSNALTLVTYLEGKYRERDDLGYSVDRIAEDLDWSTTKVRNVIDWSRNRMLDSRYMIHAFRGSHNHSRWYYKKPTPDEALIYERARGKDVARRASHVLLLVRKRATEFGVTRETRKTSAAYVECLRWLREAGVEEAEVFLEEALQDLASTNGHHAA